MADREPTTEDILTFMDEDERRRWDKGSYLDDGFDLPEDTVRFWESLEALWRSIPDPTEDELRQLMSPEDWQVCQEVPRNREGILNFYRRKWKVDRKAAARQVEEAKQLPASTTEPLPPSPPNPKGPTASLRKGLADMAKQMEQNAKGPDFTPLIDSLKEQDDRTKRAIRSLVWGEPDEPRAKPELPGESDSATQSKPATPPEDFLEFHRNAQDRVELRRYPPLESAEEQALRTREELLIREERLQTEKSLEQRKRELDNVMRQPPRSEYPQGTVPHSAMPVPVGYQSKTTEMPEPKINIDLWSEIKTNRAWYVPAFLLSGLPIYVATLWGPIVGSKTIPEWLAEHRWPSLSTLIIGWVIGIALIAAVIVARSYQTVRQKRGLLAAQRASVAFELTRLSFERYDDDTQIMLARFKYRTGVGYSPKVEVKAHLTIFDQTSLRLPEYAGAWHGSTVRSKRFSTGDSADLVVGLVNRDGMIGYEYHLSKVAGVTLDANLTELSGQQFYVQAVFIARTRTDDDIVLFETTQWFKVKAGAKPLFIETTPPSQFW